MWQEHAPPERASLELESPFVEPPPREARAFASEAAYEPEASPFAESAWEEDPAAGEEVGYGEAAYDEAASGDGAYGETLDFAGPVTGAEFESEEDAEHADGEDYLSMEGEVLDEEAAWGAAEAFGEAPSAAFEDATAEAELDEESAEWEDGAATELDQDGELVETEAAFAPEPALEREDLAAPGVTVDAFVPALARVWAERLNRSVPRMEEWLRQDLADTLVGARARARMLGARPPGDDRVTRAWMVGREQDMKFQTIPSPVPALTNFAAPAGTALVASAAIPGSNEADSKVAPFTVDFVAALRRRHPRFTVGTYSGHGGAGFLNRGYSLDFRLGSTRDDRGFYAPADAEAFLRAVHATARQVGAEWRAIYNDFAVADAINRDTGARRVVFVGKVRRNRAGDISNLNWHGPDPLILHVHLDLMPRASGPAAGRPSSPAANAKPPAELTRFAQIVLNRAEGERLVVDGDYGPRTAAAVARFRQRYGLGAGGTMDAATGLGLVQRGLEEVGQQSIFPQTGVRDAATDREITSFRLRHGLGASAAVDAALRNALAAALQRRGGTPAASPAPSPAGAPATDTGGLGGLGGLAALAAPTTAATIANALAITKIIAGYHGVPWRVCFTLLAHEGGVRLVRHHDGVMQTIASARRSVIPKIPLPLARALLGLPASDATPAAALATQLHAAFPRRLAVQIAAGIQELKVNLDAFDGYVALAYQAYNVGPGWSNYTVTGGRSKARPRGLSTEEWARMCREGATLLHRRASGVRVSAGVWQCDRNMPGWFRHYAVYDRATNRQLIGYKYLRSFTGQYHAHGPAKATCTIATHGAAHRQTGTGPLTTETTRAGSLDKLYDPAKLGGAYAAAVRAELTPIADDGLPLRTSGGALVKVRPDGTTLPA